MRELVQAREGAQVTATLTAYDPATDPHFYADVVNDLRDHRGEWRHSGRIVADSRGGEVDCAYLASYTGKVVNIARSLGDIIEGDDVTGYRYLGWRKPPYVRVYWPRHQRKFISSKPRKPIKGQLPLGRV